MILQSTQQSSEQVLFHLRVYYGFEFFLNGFFFFFHKLKVTQTKTYLVSTTMILNLKFSLL